MTNRICRICEQGYRVDAFSMPAGCKGGHQCDPKRIQKLMEAYRGFYRTVCCGPMASQLLNEIARTKDEIKGQ